MPLPRLPRLPLRLPLYYPLVAPLFGDPDHYFTPYNYPGVYPPPSGGWVLVRDCHKPITVDAMGFWSTGITSYNCLNGQAGNWKSLPWTAPPSARSVVFGHGYEILPGQKRHDNEDTYNRPATGVVGEPPFRAVPRSLPYPSGGMPDPNIVRGLPSPDPVPHPASPQPAPAPLAPPEWQWSNTPPGKAPPPRHRRRPPRSGTKERKAISRSRAFLVWLFGFLDDLSELAEIVGALYDALPDSVKKRWGKGRRGFVDNAGQYGIDGADWKLQALYHNWDKLDAAQALRNIARNSLQDEFYGLLHKNLPPGAARATGENASKPFNDWVEAALDLVFLE